jgi:hypothetical protein
MNDARRIELKKEFLIPYEEVEKQFKGLATMIGTVIMNIDEQVREFENKAKDQKREEITKLWESMAYNKIKLTQIWDETWLNKGSTMKQIKEDMEDAVTHVEADLSVIDGFTKDQEVANTLKAKYLLSLNLNTTLTQHKAEQAAKELLKVKVEPKLVKDGRMFVSAKWIAVLGK